MDDLEFLRALMSGAVTESPVPDWSGILVVAETRGKALAAVSLEIMGRARELADGLGVHVSALLLGHDVKELAALLIAGGADTVYVVDSPELAGYDAAQTIAVAAMVIQQRKPEIVLIPATRRGCEWAPRLATRLHAGLLVGCIALDLDEKERLLLATCPTHGFRMRKTIVCPVARPQIATLLPGHFRAISPDHERDGCVELMARPDAGITSPTSWPVAFERPRPPLRQARVIVSGGRGIGGSPGFVVLDNLARTLGAATGATQSAVEFGWAPRSSMVDIAGAQVHPQLYIAVGISGAFSHRIAIRGTQCLVAINCDAAAPIFKRCDFGIVGDWHDVVPALADALREVQSR